MKQIIRKILKDDIHIKMTHVGLDKFIRDMDRSSNRIAFSMIISAILLSSAIMHATGVGPKYTACPSWVSLPSVSLSFWASGFSYR